MANKPVKVLSDLLTKKQILKQDQDGNILFKVSGTLEDGVVITSLPLTASAGIEGRLYGTASYALNVPDYYLNIYTTGSVTGSGMLENPIALKDPLVIGTISSSYLYVSESLVAPNITGNLFGTASYAEYAGNANIGVEVKNAHARLKYQEVGYFDIDGFKTVMLPNFAYGAASFPTSSIDFLNINVYIKDNGRWTNDLVAVESYVSGGNIFIDISAPALTNTDEYKLLANNENPDDYVIL